MTRDQMVDYVCDRLVISDGDTNRITLIQTMLGNAHRRIVAELGLLQNTTTLNTVAGTPAIALPSDCVRIRAMKRNSRPMKEISWQVLANADIETDATTLETYYAMKGDGSIYLHPVPSESETGAITIWYDAYPTAMSLGSSEPEGIPSAYHEIIPETVIARVALAEEEIGLAQAAQSLAMEMRMALQTIVNRRGGQHHPQQPVPGLRAY